EFVPSTAAPADLSQRLGAKLQALTGARWAVILVNEGGAETIAEKRDSAELAIKAEAQKHPLVQAVLAAFPKAKITNVKSAAEMEAEAQSEALQEVEDEWDPFEED
ncbi:MAG: DNA polymerase III subunit gamma/tau, partial [Paracoccaceae bacterium]|nr:DNA polymerase III subunit gamma/tau [Paracoccaceae bacterium]